MMLALGAACALISQGCGGDAEQLAADSGPPPYLADGGLPEDDAAVDPRDAAEAGITDAARTTRMFGLHVVGNHIENARGERVILRGVNRSGTEYKCIQSGGMIFDGPNDEASVQAIKSWNVNAVRIPLNEACWLGINGAPEITSGAVYKDAIRAYVALLERYDIVPILDLHWVGPGTSRADRLQPMPDLHAVDFWIDVATTFRDDQMVVFEPFNEPFPNGNNDNTGAWTCWRDGCMAPQAAPPDAGALMTYEAVGMQALVNAIRGADAANLILLGGVQYSNTLSQWLNYRPTDPLNNLAAAWHVYNNNPCRTEACWDIAVARVAAMVPVVTTEIGQNDCDGAFIKQVMNWLDARNTGYLAWTWDVYGTGMCRPTTPTQQGQPFPLIINYDGTPKGVYGQTFRDHLLGL